MVMLEQDEHSILIIEILVKVNEDKNVKFWIKNFTLDFILSKIETTDY